MATYTLHVKIDSTLFRQGQVEADALILARKVNGVINTAFAGFAFNPRRGSFSNLLPNVTFEWKEEYRITAVSPPGNGEQIDRATMNVPIAIGEVTTFNDRYDFSEPAEKQPEGFFLSSGSFGVRNLHRSLNASVMMNMRGHWSTIHVDQSSRNGPVAFLQPQEYYLFWKSGAEDETLYHLNEAEGQKIIFNPGETSKTIHFGFNNPEEPWRASWYFT